MNFVEHKDSSSPLLTSRRKPRRLLSMPSQTKVVPVDEETTVDIKVLENMPRRQPRHSVPTVKIDCWSNQGKHSPLQMEKCEENKVIGLHQISKSKSTEDILDATYSRKSSAPSPTSKQRAAHWNLGDSNFLEFTPLGQRGRSRSAGKLPHIISNYGGESKNTLSDNCMKKKNSLESPTKAKPGEGRCGSHFEIVRTEKAPVVRQRSKSLEDLLNSVDSAGDPLGDHISDPDIWSDHWQRVRNEIFCPSGSLELKKLPPILKSKCVDSSCVTKSDNKPNSEPETKLSLEERLELIEKMQGINTNFSERNSRNRRSTDGPS